MDLDDSTSFPRLDSLNMCAEINGLPDQLEQAFRSGREREAPFPPDRRPPFERVLIAGMGGSAIGADLLLGYAQTALPLPVVVHRDYGLPGWARGPETLVIASSHSGNTEETLDSFEAARQAGCSILAVCTGGELERRARAARIPVWTFTHAGQPRAAVGYSFGLLLAAFTRLGILPEPGEALAEALQVMRGQQAALGAAVPVADNPAKRLAGQLVGRWVNVYGAGHLATVARRWKGQLNENAKAGAGFELLPEADHNALAGLANPSELLARTMTLFLQAGSLHPRLARRAELTRRAFLQDGMNTDVYQAPGGTPLSQLWAALHFGDYVSYYLAIAYDADPTPIQALVDFKAAMAAAR